MGRGAESKVAGSLLRRRFCGLLTDFVGAVGKEGVGGEQCDNSGDAKILDAADQFFVHGLLE